MEQVSNCENQDHTNLVQKHVFFHKTAFFFPCSCLDSGVSPMVMWEAARQRRHETREVMKETVNKKTKQTNKFFFNNAGTLLGWLFFS